MYRDGKSLSKRNTERQSINRHQSTKSCMDYLNIIFYFGYLKVFSFLMFVRIHGENFASIPKVSYEHFQYGVRVTEDMILQNCTCSLPLPGPSPCFTVNTARNLVLLLCQFFQPEKCSAMCLLFFF